MKEYREYFRRMKTVEDRFFEIDRGSKKAQLCLRYTGPDDIFVGRSVTRTPMLNDDFVGCFYDAFEYIPRKYKVDMDIVFDNLEGWTEDDLRRVIEENILLKAKTHWQNYRERNKLAYSLCCVGAFFIILSLMIARIWEGDGFWKDFVVYMLDIIATVPFWGAIEIFFIDNRQDRNRTNYLKRIGQIRFMKKIGKIRFRETDAADGAGAAAGGERPAGL